MVFLVTALFAIGLIPMVGAFIDLSDHSQNPSSPHHAHAVKWARDHGLDPQRYKVYAKLLTFLITAVLLVDIALLCTGVLK